MKFTLRGWRDVYGGRGEPEELHRLSGMYWATLMGVAAAIALFSVCYGMWELLRERGTALEMTSGAGIVGFNREQLQIIVRSFEKRSAEFEELIAR